MWKDDITRLHHATFGTEIDFERYENTVIFKQQNDVLVGYVLFSVVADFADLHYITVAPEFRNLGFGISLMEDFVIDVAGRGVSEITLEVQIDNQTAIGLYESFGFEKVGLRKGYYAGIDGLLMRLTL